MTTKIIGTGSYVPAQIVTNDDLSKIVETNDQWIRSRTGIGERRIATDDSTSDMAAKAAARAIEQAGIDPEEIDLIILLLHHRITAFQMEPVRSRQRWVQLMQPALISVLHVPVSYLL